MISIQVKAFPFPSQNVRTKRGEYFFKCADISIGQNNHKELGKHIIKGTKPSSSYLPQRNGDLGIVYKEFKIITLKKLNEL